MKSLMLALLTVACTPVFAKTLVCEGNRSLMIFSMKNDIVAGDSKVANIIVDDWLTHSRTNFGSLPIKMTGLSISEDKSNFGVTFETTSSHTDPMTLQAVAENDSHDVIAVGYNSKLNHAFLNYGSRMMNLMLGLSFLASPDKDVSYRNLVELPNCVSSDSTLAMEPLQSKGGALATTALYDIARSCRKSQDSQACFDKKVYSWAGVAKQLDDIYDSANFVDQYGDVQPRNQQVNLVLSMYKKLMTQHSPNYVLSSMKGAMSAEDVAREDDRQNGN